MSSFRTPSRKSNAAGTKLDHRMRRRIKPKRSYLLKSGFQPVMMVEAVPDVETAEIRQPATMIRRAGAGRRRCPWARPHRIRFAVAIVPDMGARWRRWRRLRGKRRVFVFVVTRFFVMFAVVMPGLVGGLHHLCLLRRAMIRRRGQRGTGQRQTCSQSNPQKLHRALRAHQNGTVFPIARAWECCILRIG